MVKVSAPGKVCIAGEWAVLEKGNPLIVAAINKRIFTRIKKSKDDFIYISIKDFGIKRIKASVKNQKLVFEKRLNKKQKQELLFVKKGIETIIQYLGSIEPFEISIQGKQTTAKIKNKTVSVGIGTSAASVVVVIASLLRFHGKDIKRKDSKGKIYKLAAITHYFAQGKIGSCFDIASSIFGGVIAYKKFDSDWLVKQIEKSISLNEIIAMEWPHLYIKSLYIPKNIQLLLGWTGKLSSTPKMVKKMNKWRSKNKREYKRRLNKIGDLVEDIIKAWNNEEKENIFELLNLNRKQLKELGEKTGINIETKELALLSDIANQNGGVGKLSGAGGGDCGIALVFDKKSAKKIIQKWKENKITPIKTELSIKGVKEEK